MSGWPLVRTPILSIFRPSKNEYLSSHLWTRWNQLSRLDIVSVAALIVEDVLCGSTQSPPVAAFSNTSTSDPCELCVRPTTDAHRSRLKFVSSSGDSVMLLPGWEPIAPPARRCPVRAVLGWMVGRPLPTHRSVLPVSRSFRNSVSEPDLVQFFSGNSARL